MANLGTIFGTTVLQLLGCLYPTSYTCSALSCYNCRAADCVQTIECTTGQKHCMELYMTWRNGETSYTQSCTPFGNFCRIESDLAELSSSTSVKCRICSYDLCNEAGAPAGSPPPTLLLMLAAAALCANAFRR